MLTSATVPVHVTPEAAARITARGLQDGVDRIIQYAKQHLAELTRIEVVLYERDEPGDEPGLAVETYCRYESFSPAARIHGRMGDWLVSEFPSPILEQLVIDYLPEDPDAG